MANQCSVCLGTAFSHEEGLIVCLTCGTQGQAFVEEAADYDAALAEGARARVRVRGPTAAARAAAAAAKATAEAGAAEGATAAAGTAAGLQQQQQLLPQLRGAHVVAASLLALQRSLVGIMEVLVADFGVEPVAKAEARRLWGLAVAAARVFGDDKSDDGDGENDDGDENSTSVAARAEERAETWRDASEQGGGKSSPEAASSLAFSAGRELLRRGLGPRCLLSLALLSSWRAAAAAQNRDSNSNNPPVTPLDLVRGAACGAIPFLDLSPFAAAAAAAAAAAPENTDDGTNTSPLSLPPRLASLPLVSPRLLRPRSLPGADRVAARAARLGRALSGPRDSSSPRLASSPSSPPSPPPPPPPPPPPLLLPALPNPAALASRWILEMGAPPQLAAIAAELYHLLAPSALASVASASSRRRTPGSKTTTRKKKGTKRKERAEESGSERGSERNCSSEDDDDEEEEEEEGASDDDDVGETPRRLRRQQQKKRPAATSLDPPALTDDSRLDPVRALAASLLLSLKLCYGLGGPPDRIDMRGFGQKLPGLPAAPRVEKGEGEDDDESDGDDDESGEVAVARGWRRWASAVVEASGKPLLPASAPQLGVESDRYVEGVSRGVFCGGGGAGGELEAALSSRAAAAAAAASAAARRSQEHTDHPVPRLPPPPLPRRRRKSDEEEKGSAFWKPGRPWLCACWQPARAVEEAASAAAAAAGAGAGAAPAAAPTATLASSSSSFSRKGGRPSDFALPPSYAAVLAAVSAHCGYVPRALHETAVALEDELSRERRSVN